MKSRGIKYFNKNRIINTIIITIIITSSFMSFTLNIGADSPIQTGENPPDGSVNIPSNPILFITVDDPDNDTLNVYWYTNVSGSWEQFATNLSIDTSGGAVQISQFNEDFNEYSTTYWWSVHCSDGTNWTNMTYQFTRGPNIPPLSSDPNPSNNSINVNPAPICSATINDDNLDTMTVYFYDNATHISDTLSYQVSHDGDDAYFYKNSMRENQDYVTMNFWEPYTIMGGLRFRNLQIPQGATITDANLRMHIYDKYDPDDYDDPHCIIYGDDVDNSEVIEGGTSLDERSLTTANVAWNENNLGDSWVESPDISNIIQEIIDRPGWTIGNSMTIISDDVQTNYGFRCWDYQYDDHSYAAYLDITYITDEVIWTLQQTNTNVDPGSTVTWNNFENASDFNTKYWWSVNATDGELWSNVTYQFTTREKYIPNPPSAFNANTYNRTRIDLSWNKGAKADYTYIEWNSINSWSRGQGTLLYNGKGTTVSHEGLEFNTEYFYQAWSWNETDNAWSTTYSSDSATTDPNIIPTQTGEIPTNGSTKIKTNPTLYITVNDADEDSLNVYWYYKSSGHWFLLATNTNVDTTSGPVQLSQTNDYFNKYSTTYWWQVKLTDSYSWTNKTYFFTTKDPSIPPPPLDFNANKYNRSQINLEWTNNPGNNTYIEWNTYSTWLPGEGTLLVNTTTLTSYEHIGLNSGTRYYYRAWGYNVTDDLFSTTNLTANAKTDENNATALSGETPPDNSIGISLTQSKVNVTIEDADGDLFDWTIEGQYIDNTGGNDDTDGNKQANIQTPLPFGTDIIWYVNVSDGYESTNATYTFTSREAYYPNPPTNLIASPYSRTVVNLTWETNQGNNSIIEWNNIETWGPGEGTRLVNSTSIASYNHTGLDPGTINYYRAWSWNKTDNVFSMTNVSASATTPENYPTTLGPPNTPNGSASHNTSFSWNLMIVDNDDPFTWYINCSNGQKNSSVDDTSGLKELYLSGLSEGTKYYVWVDATDGFGWTRKWFSFITKTDHEPPLPINFTATTLSKSQIELSWENTGTNYTYIEWYSLKNWARGDGHPLEYTNTNTSYIHTGLESGTKYYYQAWSYNETWNVYSTYVEASAKTTSNKPPVIESSSPSNGAKNLPRSLTWSVLISDADNDLINWSITCINGQSTNGDNDTSGRKELQISGLAYNTGYTVWVDADDGHDSSSMTYYFSTAPKSSPSPPPPPPPPFDDVPPSNPTNVKCATPVDDNTPTFSWNSASDESGINGYYAKIDDESDKWIGNVRSWTSTDEIDDGIHTFYVKAQDASTNSNQGGYGTCIFTIITKSTDGVPVAHAGGPYFSLTFQNITFDGSRSYDVGGKIVSGYWDFGDGTNGTGTRPTHMYTEAGIFNLTLTITDDEGLTATDITNVTVYLDSDRDGWSDEIETIYGTDINDPDDNPLDTDGDGLPDENAPDKSIWGDYDDDNDGLDDYREGLLGSDSKNKSDVIMIEINNVTYFLVDINNDRQLDLLYHINSDTNTTVKKRDDGSYLLDTTGDGKWDYIYNYASGEVIPHQESASDEFPLLTITLVIIVIIIITIIMLFKIGYLYIEIEEEPQKTSRKSKIRNSKK